MFKMVITNQILQFSLIATLAKSPSRSTMGSTAVPGIYVAEMAVLLTSAQACIMKHVKNRKVTLNHQKVHCSIHGVYGLQFAVMHQETT